MHAIGIDIGGTRIKAGLVSRSGELERTAMVKTPGTLEAFRETLAAMTAELARGTSLAGVGIGCKGFIDPATTLVEYLPGTMHFLEGLRLADLVAQAVPPGTTVRADNDARAALAGEIVWGAAQGRTNVMMLTLGTGVGGAMLCDGVLVRGARGMGGHLGHIMAKPDGRDCICGNRGCLETEFSAKAIEAEAIAAVMRGCASALTEEFRHAPHTVTCEAVFRSAAEGDAVACHIRDQAMKYLGAAVAGLLLAMDPEILIVGGQIAESGEAVFAPLRRDLYERTRGMLGREVPVVPAKVGERSGIVGAAALVLYT